MAVRRLGPRRGRRRGVAGPPSADCVTWGRLAGGFGLALVPLLLAPVLAQLLWMLLVAIRPGYREMLDPWQPNWFRAGVVALVATVLLTWYGLLRKRIGAWALALGGLLWLAVLGLVLAAVTPGGSYLAALPALAVAIGLIVSLLVSGPWARLLAVTVGGAVAVRHPRPDGAALLPGAGAADRRRGGVLRGHARAGPAAGARVPVPASILGIGRRVGRAAFRPQWMPRVFRGRAGRGCWGHCRRA